MLNSPFAKFGGKSQIALLGMNEIPTLITERVDDIPLLLEQMQQMGLPTLLDHGGRRGRVSVWP